VLFRQMVADARASLTTADDHGIDPLNHAAPL
jgi:hypothetical protein